MENMVNRFVVEVHDVDACRDYADLAQINPAMVGMSILSIWFCVYTTHY